MSDARLTAVLLVLLVLNATCMVAIAQRVADLSLSRAAAERALLTQRTLLYTAPED